MSLLLFVRVYKEGQHCNASSFVEMSLVESFAPELKERIARSVALAIGISQLTRLALVSKSFASICQLVLFGKILVDYHNVVELTEILLRKTSTLTPGSSLLALVHTVVLLPSATIPMAHFEKIQCVLGNRALQGFHNLANPARTHATTMSASRLEHLSICHAVDVSFLSLSTFVHLKTLRLEGSLRGCDPLPDFAPPVTSLTLANVSPKDVKKLVHYFKRSLDTAHCRFLCKVSLAVTNIRC